MEAIDLLLSPYEQSPPLVTHQALGSCTHWGGDGHWGEAGAGAWGQQLKLSPSTAGLRCSATAGNYSFSKFSLTGWWKTRFISQSFSCFLVLAESHTGFAGILPPSSLLWDRFCVLSAPAALLLSKAHASDGSSYVSPLVVVFSSELLKVWGKDAVKGNDNPPARPMRGAAGAWQTVFLLKSLRKPVTYVSIWSVEQICMGRATFVTLLLPPQLRAGPLILCAQQPQPPRRSLTLPVPQPVLPRSPWELSRAHKTSRAAAHTFLHAAGLSWGGASPRRPSLPAS